MFPEARKFSVAKVSSGMSLRLLRIFGAFLLCLCSVFFKFYSNQSW